MRVFTLKRVSYKNTGIFGTLEDEREIFAVTIENPQLKIPKGEYMANLDFYHKGNYPVYELIVPGRTRILTHKANLGEELEGCIAIGESYGILKGRAGILDSAGGFKEFMDRTASEPQIKFVILEPSFT